MMVKVTTLIFDDHHDGSNCPSKGRLPQDTKRGLLDDLLETKPSSSGGPERAAKTSFGHWAPWGEVMGFGEAWGDSLGLRIIELALLLWSYLSHPSVAAQHPQWCWQDMESLLRQRWFLHCCHHHRDLHVVYLGSDLFVGCQDVIWTYEHTLFLSISCVDLPELFVELFCTPYLFLYVHIYIYIYLFIYFIHIDGGILSFDLFKDSVWIRKDRHSSYETRVWGLDL